MRPITQQIIKNVDANQFNKRPIKFVFLASKSPNLATLTSWPESIECGGPIENRGNFKTNHPKLLPCFNLTFGHAKNYVC